MKKDLIFAPIMLLVGVALFLLRFTGMPVHIAISVVGVLVLAAYTVLSGHEIEMLSGLELLDAEKKDSNCWTVVYVSPGDTSWSIAKRYGVSKSEMQGDPATDKFVIIER